KFPTCSTKFSTADLGKKENVVKASACYWDSGCSRHMTGNISYLSDYDEIDVKSAFLCGTIDEEVYVMQPLGFQDPEFPARIYKVEKAMGTIDNTHFIKRQRGDFILVQVYVDDIIFGSLNPQLCSEFDALMHEKFQMSAMASNDKEMELWVELKRMYKPDPEDQLWTLTQNYMHAPIKWKLYDLSGVYHIVTTARRKEMPLPEVCTAIEEKKKKLPVKDRWQLH
nr:hypothetical protein [Tanacetum cinerariifolium]